MSPPRARAIAGAILLAMLAVYYSGGIRFQIWPDSLGYLEQAEGLRGERPFTRPADRTVGYPIIIAAALATPAPLLAIWALQIAVVMASFAALHRAIAARAGPDLAPRLSAKTLAGIALIGIALAAHYSILHVQAGALLTEIVFAGLALAAVLAAIAFARREPGTLTAGAAVARAALAAAIAASPLLVKPHWLLAAVVLGAAIALQLWRQLASLRAGLPAQVLRIAIAVAVPLLVILGLTLPDRMLSRASGGREALFGPRAVFCNHLHMIDATLARRPSLALQEDPAFEATLRRYFKDVQARYVGGWRRLGFDGDLCSFDASFSALLDRRFPEIESQRRFLLGAVWRAAFADPLPYAAKVLRHTLFGFTTAFEKFAHHAAPGRAALEAVGRPGLSGGVRMAESIGPLASADAMKRSWPGLLLQAALAAVFFSLTGLLVALAAAALVAPLVFWRRWSGEVRRGYLVWVALPLAALLGHHALIALTHSFDVWRYGFNMFFVNLLFVGTAGLFAASRWRER